MAKNLDISIIISVCQLKEAIFISDVLLSFKFQGGVYSSIGILVVPTGELSVDLFYSKHPMSFLNWIWKLNHEPSFLFLSLWHHCACLSYAYSVRHPLHMIYHRCTDKDNLFTVLHYIFAGVFCEELLLIFMDFNNLINGLFPYFSKFLLMRFYNLHHFIWTNWFYLFK